MGFIGWIILGILAGAIAKAIMPGKQGGGIFATMILGIVGAVVGGYLGSLIFNVDVQKSLFSLSTWVIAIGGSLIVLAVWGYFTGKKN
ncbi:GlsB/YeaQ/YmgE family stress response membrane protein [Dermabacteraceae bacterium P13115]